MVLEVKLEPTFTAKLALEIDNQNGLTPLIVDKGT